VSRPNFFEVHARLKKKIMLAPPFRSKLGLGVRDVGNHFICHGLCVLYQQIQVVTQLVENGGSSSEGLTKRYAFINTETQGGEGEGGPRGLLPKYDSSFYLVQNHSRTAIQYCIALE